MDITLAPWFLKAQWKTQDIVFVNLVYTDIRTDLPQKGRVYLVLPICRPVNAARPVGERVRYLEYEGMNFA